MKQHLSPVLVICKHLYGSVLSHKFRLVTPEKSYRSKKIAYIDRHPLQCIASSSSSQNVLHIQNPPSPYIRPNLPCLSRRQILLSPFDSPLGLRRSIQFDIRHRISLHSLTMDRPSSASRSPHVHCRGVFTKHQT